MLRTATQATGDSEHHKAARRTARHPPTGRGRRDREGRPRRIPEETGVKSVWPQEQGSPPCRRWTRWGHRAGSALRDSA